MERENEGSRVCEVLRLGRIEYREAWSLQERMAGEIAAGIRPAALLLLEHLPVYTMGRMSSPKHLLWDAVELKRRGIELVQSDRGGDVTYHGPGQLVGYPLLPLARPGWNAGLVPKADYVGYVRKLEQALILALERMGVLAEARGGLTGVWVRADQWAQSKRGSSALPAKIASIGIKVDARGVTRHGFALNIDTHGEHWRGIVACGLEGVVMANLSDFLDPVPATETVIAAVAGAFGEVMKYEMIEG